jgi:3,4-dihydroxy 2-butanone 4-phosphate synthase/GTP cyclohydrolase II
VRVGEPPALRFAQHRPVVGDQLGERPGRGQAGEPGQVDRGLGLMSKLRAYELQERGRDTLDANLELGLPADARDYAAAAGILSDLGVSKVRLLTNNTDKVKQLRELGLDVVEQVPLIVGVGPNNHQYLETKRDRMGHIIGEAELAQALANGKDDA